MCCSNWFTLTSLLLNRLLFTYKPAWFLYFDKFWIRSYFSNSCIINYCFKNVYGEMWFHKTDKINRNWVLIETWNKQKPNSPCKTFIFNTIMHKLTMLFKKPLDDLHQETLSTASATSERCHDRTNLANDRTYQKWQCVIF